MSNTEFSEVCHEFTNALTEVLAENAGGLARRGRLARARAAVKRHPDYSEHALKRCFADQRPAAVFNCPAQADVV